MNREQAEKLSKDALNELAAQLEGGRSKRLIDYLATMARFPQYSLRNVMLIASQRPDASRVAGFHAWRKLGRFVKKGEKGIAIVAPIARRKDAADDEGPVRGFRVVTVFDILSTDGQALPEMARISGDPGGATATLRRVIASRGIELCYVEELPGALGRSLGGKIEILTTLDPAQEFEVLAHELGHELLHRRDTAEVIPSRDVRELEAEAVAYTVATGVGLDAKASSVDYIGLFQGSKDLLLASLDRIQRAASEILRELNPRDPKTQRQRAPPRNGRPAWARRHPTLRARDVPRLQSSLPNEVSTPARPAHRLPSGPAGPSHGFSPPDSREVHSLPREPFALPSARQGLAPCGRPSRPSDAPP